MKIEACSALITGGASGLGFAAASEFAQAGAAVVIADLATSAGAARAEAIGARFVPADITDADSVALAVEAASLLGPLRIAVNCAGVSSAQKIIGSGGPYPVDDFVRVVSVNLIGAFNVIRIAAAAMARTAPVDGERGVIVATASIAAFDGQVGQAAYSASKGGVVAMMLPIARELARSYIRVCSIAPGSFDTPMLATLPPKVIDSVVGHVPHPARAGRPHEFAALARHIVENAYLNAETIRLDAAVRLPPQ